MCRYIALVSYMNGIVCEHEHNDQSMLVFCVGNLLGTSRHRLLSQHQTTKIDRGRRQRRPQAI